MKELLDILDAMERFAAAGERMALATIVFVRGSTYRREGARLLLTAGQQMVGNISGGCLESDIMVVADEVMASGKARLATYDLTADDDAVWGLGLGCNGAVDVFVEPLDPSSRQWTLLREVSAAEESAALAKVLDGPRAGRWMLVRSHGPRVESLGDGAFDERAARASAAAMTEGASRTITLPGDGGDVRVFVEVLRPPVRLIICGAGHDAVPVVQFAAQLGWRTVVVDQRQRFLNHDRFPGAQRFIHSEPSEAAGVVPLDDRTYVVIMTHNYLHDRDLLRGFLATPVRYVGMLGPRIRTEKILDELTTAGVAIRPEDRARIYGPIGLDIGGEGAEAIALALLGEIHAVEAGRAGGLLRDRKGPIHAPAR